VLRESGVVDAGARGFFLLLEGAYHSLFMDAGMPAPAPIPSVRRKPESLSAIAGAHGKSRGFCTELLVQGEELSLSWIRERLQNEGTSLIVVGDSATIRIHIHTQHPEAVIEYARTVGSVSGVDVQDLDSQTEQFARQAVEQQGSGVRTAVLAIASGEGIARVFRGLGAEVLVPSGTGRKPREDEIFSAMERMPSREILLLPNGREAQDAVEKAAALTAKTVTVIPALTVPQGVAALVACRFEEDPAANARIMNAAIESVRTLEIARAPEGAIPSAAGASGAIGKQQRATDGRVVGYFDGSAATTADEPARVMERLLSRLNLGEVEVITLYYGEGEAALMEKTREVFRRMLPHASVETVDGGQGEPPLIISVE
jgi:dihydroxyacetone kinase-like predicted kinase